MMRTQILTGQADFATLGQTGGERQGLPNVRLFKIGKIGQELRKRAPGGDGLHNHADRHPHAPDARLAPHLVGMDCDPLEVPHTRILPQSESRGCRHVAHAILIADVMAHANIRMVQRCHRPGFALEPLAKVFPFRDMFRQYLEASISSLVPLTYPIRLALSCAARSNMAAVISELLGHWPRRCPPCVR